MAIYEGAGVALITPFKANGEVNYDKLEEIVEEQIAGGTDAIVACGTTGEASTMTHEEHLDVIKFVCEVTKKRIPVIAGTGSNCTETAIYLSQEAEKNGADGLLVVSPYYNKATQKGLIAHFSAVANSVKIPMLLYNITGRTGIKSGPIDYSHSPVQSINLPADLFIFAGNNKELDRLTRAVDHLVDHISCNKQGYITIDHLLQIVQHKITGCNDDHIAEHHHTP